MITPSFSITATERVLPALALDFTTASLDSRVTFTRTGNTATVVNSSGLVAPINANLPRFDYNPNTLVCKGLLIEEARTNLATYSSDFSNVTWGLFGGAAVSTDTTVSPDGTQNADTITVSGGKYIEKVIVSAAGTYCFSTFYKLTGSGSVNHQLTCAGIGSTNTALSVNLTTGAVSVAFGTPVAFGSEIYGSWVRVWVVGTHVLGAIVLYYIAYAGEVSVPIWGAQLELGSFLTSYIPTVATTITRNPDVAVMTSTNFSSWYTATTGAAVVWAIPQTATGIRPLVQFDDATALEIIALRGNVADPELYIVDGGVAQAQIDAGTIVANTAYKLSGGWNTNNCAAAKDGGTVGTDVAATMPTPTQLRIGSDGTNYASAWVQKIMYWKQRIINAEVQAFSK
jgi:hypothetical protein